MISNLRKVLRMTGPALLCAALVAAPFLYGTTRVWTQSLLAAGLIIAVFIFISSSWKEVCESFRRPAPWVLLLLVQGWWMAGNAHQIWDDDYRAFIPLQEWVPWAPGSVDAMESRFAMWRLTGLLGAFLIGVSLARVPRWRHRMICTVALTGVAVAVAGIVLKVGGWQLMQWFWEKGSISHNNFAFYRYHGNAGAFLNLTLPVLFGLAVRPGTSRRAGFLWGLGAGVVLVALQINASKAALVIGFLICAVFVTRGWRRDGETLRSLCGRCWKQILTVIVVVGASSLIINQQTIYRTSWGRWKTVQEEARTTYLDRLEVDRIGLGMIRDAGCWGFGPETFSVVFPKYQAETTLGDVWHFAHNDYLQTVLEWGVAGFVFWGVLFGCGLYGVWRDRVKFPPGVFLEEAPFWALLGVLIHAGFDFPLQIDSIRLYAFVMLALCWSEKKVI